MTPRPRQRSAARPLKFDQRLVLNQWMLGLFEVDSLEKLADGMKDLEGVDEDNISNFYRHLTARLFERKELTKDLLLLYDQNIIRHTMAIQGRREQPIKWKYFQYLSLLFTEIYLDRYFRDHQGLLDSLNAHVELFNEGKVSGDRIKPYEPDDLNKIAFWNATGSGKTLLMHVNILQYRHYLKLHGRTRELNRIILLTPNEGLSAQHLKEFNLSGMQAEFFNKNGSTLFTGHSIEIIEIHKLKDEMGVKTVAVDAFEGNNLVLVDEGHRGAGGEEWMSKRNSLCEKGFSFEYSATFGQAMKAAGKPELTQQYAKCTLFDYSYKYFYHDGYGKDYRILNLADDRDEENRRLYLTACLLSFYQQQRLYADKGPGFAQFLLEKPLWVFVGGSVNAVRTESKRKVSDVVDILLFLSEFVKEERKGIEAISRLMSGSPGLLDDKQREIFRNSYAYLTKKGLNGSELYKDILQTIFNSATSGALLHVENLKGVGGEIGLRVGDHDYFGVINVGDDAELLKLCAEHGLSTSVKEFSESLFLKINDKASAVNVLIGSKKFTEGWSSWRVSTMGLMNVGRKEGSEIIQLFGRGVRLKGKDFSLKRSRSLSSNTAPPNIEVLETLNIFGVRADYMRQFKEYLEDEGLPSNEDRIDFILPVIKNLDNAKKLKTIRLKEGMEFKKQGPKPTLDLPRENMSKVVLDWYPIIQAMESKKGKAGEDAARKDTCTLKKEHIAFMDMEEVYFELQRFKNERAWHNFNLSLEKVAELLLNPDWYMLYIPKSEMEITGFYKVRRWQEIAVALLKKYCDAYYKFKKNEWELPHLEYRALDENDPNIVNEYKFLIDQSEEAVVEKLKQLRIAIESGKLKGLDIKQFAHGNFEPFMFDRHLYWPLIHIGKGTTTIEVAPVHLNEGERDFVIDLKNFYEGRKEFFTDKELYLLRNQGRGRGIGFFEANNFYPDFILWLIAGERQQITFVDPKGLRNLYKDDLKIQFGETIKDIEKRLGDSNVILNSFILSVTPYKDKGWWSGVLTKKQLEDRHVLFQIEDRNKYIEKILGG